MLTDDDKQWIREQMQCVATKLIADFHKGASPAELRVRSHAAALRVLDAEVESAAGRTKRSDDQEG